jgi:hypothetical protein
LAFAVAGVVVVSAAGCGGSGSGDGESAAKATTSTTEPSEADLCYLELSAFLSEHADDDPFVASAMAEWGRSDPRTQAVQNAWRELNRQLYEVGRTRAWEAADEVLVTECEAIASGGPEVEDTVPEQAEVDTGMDDPAIPDPSYDAETPTTLPGTETNGIDLDEVRAQAAALIVDTYGNPVDATGVDCSDPAFPPEARVPGQTFVCVIQTQDFTEATVVVRIIEGGDFTVAVLDPPHGGD